MTELTAEQENSVPEQPDETVGCVLQAARVKLGLSEQDVAGSLNLKVAVIQGIENDDFTLIPVPTYIKGYLRAYAKLLSLDEHEIIALYYQQQPVEYKPENKLKSFSKKTSQQAHDSRLMLVTYGIALILIALIVVWWIQREAVVADVNVLPSNGSQIQKHTQPKPVEVQESTTQALDEKQELTNSETIIDTVVVLEEPATELSELADIEPVVSEPAAVDSTAQLVEYNLQMTFTGDCWINVVDSTGERVAYGVKEKGRIIHLNAAPPYEVTLGAPEVVDIVFEDESIDMNQFKKGMVARFSLPLGLE